MQLPPRLSSIRRAHAASVLVLLLAGTAGAARGQSATTSNKGAIYARILDAAGDPLPAAEIVLPTLDIKFPVSANGNFLIKDVPSGVYVVQARRVGYAIQSRIVRVGADTARVEFLLAPVSQTLDTVKVTANALSWFSDFEQNRKRALGQFFTRSDITSSGAPDLSQFVRRARGIRVIPRPTAMSPDVVTTTRCASGTVVVFLDGMEISQTPDFDINLVPTSMVAAMEVYTTVATIPAKYRTDHDRCGTILLWTS